MALKVQPSTTQVAAIRTPTTLIKKIVVGTPIRRTQGTSGAIADAEDVDTSNLPNGSVLVWNSTTSKFVSQLDLDTDQDINGGSY